MSKVVCSRCGLTSQIEVAGTLFYRTGQNRATRKGWASNCKSCSQKLKKEFWVRNRNRLLGEHKARRLVDHQKSLIQEASRRLSKAANPEAILARRAVQKLSIQERYLHDRMSGWKRSAKIRGLVWSLSRSDLIEKLATQGGLCWYTGLELVLAPNSDQTISIDRVDSGLGYTTTNVVLCCTVINLMKLDLSVSDFRRFCTLVSRYGSGER